MIIENVIKFLRWAEIKILLSECQPNILFKEGEIWWCRIGMNIGVEIYGKGDEFKRPILILKKLDGRSLFGIPLTSQEKIGSWYVPVTHNGKAVVVNLSQARMLDSRRLTRRIGTLDDDEFQKVKSAFITFYGS